MKAVFDTNILIDYLSGIKQAEKEISAYSEACISIISWMEVMTCSDEEDDIFIRSFLGTFQIIPLTQKIAEESVLLRKKYKVKLPDAIIWATAVQQNCFLITRNTKDFKKDYPSIKIPY